MTGIARNHLWHLLASHFISRKLKKNYVLDCYTTLITHRKLFGTLPSVLWRHWLGGRKGIRPVKKLELWDAGMIMCLGQGADLHMAQLMPLPLTISCSSKSRLVFPSWFYFSGAGSPRLSRTESKRAVKQMCACVYVSWLNWYHWPAAVTISAQNCFVSFDFYPCQLNSNMAVTHIQVLSLFVFDTVGLLCQ